MSVKYYIETVAAILLALIIFYHAVASAMAG